MRGRVISGFSGAGLRALGAEGLEDLGPSPSRSWRFTDCVTHDVGALCIELCAFGGVDPEGQGWVLVKECIVT